MGEAGDDEDENENEVEIEDEAEAKAEPTMHQSCTLGSTWDASECRWDRMAL